MPEPFAQRGGGRDNRGEGDRKTGEQLGALHADMRHVLSALDQQRQAFYDLARKIDAEMSEKNDIINDLRDRMGRMETTLTYVRLIVFGFVAIILTGVGAALFSAAQMNTGGPLP